jgi:beta-glucosidase
VRDAVCKPANEGTKVFDVSNVIIQCIVAQDNVCELAPQVSGLDSDHNSTKIGDADPLAAKILKRKEEDFSAAWEETKESSVDSQNANAFPGKPEYTILISLLNIFHNDGKGWVATGATSSLKGGTAIHRRDFLRASISAVSAAITNVQLEGLSWTSANCAGPDSIERPPPFPADFRFGASTSSAQTEGASKAEGKGESIWDRYAQVSGHIKDGSTPEVACDSYHRWKEDIELLRQMHLSSYRFSIAWPRILPAGSGSVNQKGIDHYSRLVDHLLEADIRPLITVFHWDLPQALEENGGWPNRETADRFADYAGILAHALGDRAKHWCLLNEPQAFTVVGYGWGVHAPGKSERGLMLRATHTANLAQAKGARAMRAIHSDLQLGTAYDFAYSQPLNDTDADRSAWKRYDAFRNLWFLEPLVTGKYPEAFLDGVPLKEMDLRPGDEQILKVSLDYSGVNFYLGREFVTVGEKQALLHGLEAHTVRDKEKTYSPSMVDTMLRFTEDYARPIVITECGLDHPAAPDTHGHVRDIERLQYLQTALYELRRAMLKGADVRGFHVWSLLDNWEWTDGFATRLGLVYVDYEQDLKRLIKDSGLWYGKVARTRSIPG